MKKLWAALLTLGVSVLSGYFIQISARIEYAKETGKKCIYCHATTRPSAADLHWAGKYYAEKRTLKGYQPDALTSAAQIIAGLEDCAEEESDPEQEGRELRQVYHTKCAVCHGPRGKGVPGLNVPDLTDSSWQASRTDAEIRKAIEKGVAPLMPPFAESVDEETLEGLVRLMRRFGAGDKGKGEPPER